MDRENHTLPNKKIGEIIKGQAEAYKAANRTERGEILDSLECVTRRSRKSLIRSLSREVKHLPHSGALPVHVDIVKIHQKQEIRGRPRKYTKMVEAALA